MSLDPCKFNLRGQSVAETFSFILLVAALAGGIPSPCLAASNQEPSPTEIAIAKLVKDVPGVVGVAGLHVEVGRLVTLNGNERFPMASTYNVPIAVQLLTKVQRGELKLDQMVSIREVDLRPGGIMESMLRHPGLSLSLYNLLEIALASSDPTASDRVLHLAGGPKAVTARMHELGFKDMRVDRSSLQLILASGGFEGAIRDDAYSRETYIQLIRSISQTKAKAALAKLAQDERDSSTPVAMAQLLAGLVQEQVLDAKHSKLLIDIMGRNRGGRRIRANLPRAMNPAPHQAGTFTSAGTVSVLNDVGIITLPGGRGHAVVVVFIKGAEQSYMLSEMAVARITRKIVDAFMSDSSN